jgi:hypothetical protein
MRQGPGGEKRAAAGMRDDGGLQGIGRTTTSLANDAELPKLPNRVMCAIISTRSAAEPTQISGGFSMAD